MLIVAVTGGRDYDDWPNVWKWLDSYAARGEDMIVLQGGASGADKAARDWAHKRGLQCVTYHYRNRGKSGGPLRNAAMIEHGRPDVLLAFPGGAGTENCVAAAVFGPDIVVVRCGAIAEAHK